MPNCVMMSHSHPHSMTVTQPPLHVLIVEDNEVNRRVVTQMLERLGCRVSAAVDGAEGVRLAAEGPYGAIFMDCSMPVMDGYEASRQIRLLPGAQSRVPILALTAHATAADRTRCLVAGMDAWIPKPVSLDDLSNAIAQYAGWKGVATVEEIILDTATVNGLLDLADPDDPEFLRDLVQQFRKSAEDNVESALRYVVAGRYPETIAVVAKLRASATSVGAVRLIEACEWIEVASHETLAERGAEWVQGLSKHILKAMVALDSALAGK